MNHVIRGCAGFAVAAILLVPTAGHAQIATWNFNSFSDTGTEFTTPIAADQAAAGVTVGPLTLGPAPFGMRGFLARTYGTDERIMRFVNGPAGANTQQGALDRNLYVGFSLTPLGGSQLDLTTLSFDAWSANITQRRTFFVRYSLDGFASFTEVIGPTVAPASGDAPTAATANINLTGITGTIDFRIYGYNADGTSLGSTASNRGLQYDNIVVNGTTAMVPEPASLSLLAVGLIGLGVRHRRRSA